MFLITLFNHIITLVYYFLIKPTTELVKKQMDEGQWNGKVKQKQMDDGQWNGKVKWNI